MYGAIHRVSTAHSPLFDLINNVKGFRGVDF